MKISQKIRRTSKSAQNYPCCMLLEKLLQNVSNDECFSEEEKICPLSKIWVRLPESGVNF